MAELESQDGDTSICSECGQRLVFCVIRHIDLRGWIHDVDAPSRKWLAREMNEHAPSPMEYVELRQVASS